ncbi:uncharacterized protein V6R79_007907 [Siganus canaliculatus]
MECWDNTIFSLSWTLIVGGVAYLLHQRKNHTQYGRYAPVSGYCPARLGWFLQEVPSFMLPLLLLFTEDAQKSGNKIGRTLLVCTFMLHYFHRSFIYAFLTRGRPMPMPIVAYAAIFCSVNGFLQGHHLLHCVQFELSWLTVSRMTAGSLLFVVGLTINIHSDHILRTLRKPGETVYRIPYETTSRGLMNTLAAGKLSFLSCCDDEEEDEEDLTISASLTTVQ